MINCWTTIVLLLFVLNKEKPTQELPSRWYSAGSHSENYAMGIDKKTFRTGTRSAFIESIVGETEGFGTLMQVCPANQYLGRKVRFNGYIKTENVSDCAAIWLRIVGEAVHSEGIEMVEFKNTCDATMTGTNDWEKIEIVLYVPIRSQLLNFGALLAGSGKIWFDDFQIEIDSEQGNKSISPHLANNPQNLGFEE